MTQVQNQPGAPEVPLTAKGYSDMLQSAQRDIIASAESTRRTINHIADYLRLCVTYGHKLDRSVCTRINEILSHDKDSAFPLYTSARFLPDVVFDNEDCGLIGITVPMGSTLGKYVGALTTMIQSFGIAMPKLYPALRHSDYLSQCAHLDLAVDPIVIEEVVALRKKVPLVKA